MTGSIPGAQHSSMTVQQAGEAVVLSTVLAALETRSDGSVRLGPGDDAAVLGVDGDLVVTTDSMVSPHDFRLDFSTPFEVGFKMAATNLSDVAAMGAHPLALTVACMLPGTLPLHVVSEIARGLRAACDELAPTTRVVGGDLAQSDTLSFAVTALGECRGVAPVTRSGARGGDVVAYAGQLGLAGHGLHLLLDRDDSGRSPTERVQALRQEHPASLEAQLCPRPPIALGPIAALAGATAMLDISDSLSLDATRLAEASNVSLDLSSPALLSVAPIAGLTSDERLRFALNGGEDHGLLATFPSDAEIPDGFAVVGRVGEGPAAVVLDGTTPVEPRGWDALTH